MAITRVKVCCISSKEEAQMTIEFGASALGLVGHMPSGPGVITDALIGEICTSVPRSISTFLLTSETKARDIIEHHSRVQTSTIQIVDEIDTTEEYATLRRLLKNVKLVQVIHVLNEDSIRQAIEVSRYVDAILLDSGNPNLDVKVLGGTGKTHNWNLSRQIRESISTPVFLAGGLNADNVREAIDIVRPFGVDLCSGVRTNGRLDRNKLKAFFEAINGTF